jgi:hypothetical protein
MPCKSLEPAKAAPTRLPTRRSRNCALARRPLVSHQKEGSGTTTAHPLHRRVWFFPPCRVSSASMPRWDTSLCCGHAGLTITSPRSVRSGQGVSCFFTAKITPLIWINLGNVVTFLEHLLRGVPGRMVIIWDGSPIHRSHTIRDFLTNGVLQCLHRERLLAYVPDLNPDEGDWQQLKGIKRRNLCCLHLPYPRCELCHAVKRIQRNHV